MREHGFSLTRILLYKDRIVDSERIWVNENRYSRIFYAVYKNWDFEYTVVNIGPVNIKRRICVRQTQILVRIRSPWINTAEILVHIKTSLTK